MVVFPFPYGNLGSNPDGVPEKIPSGPSYIILQFTPSFTVKPGTYLVYYPGYSGSSTVPIDVVALELGDGTNWYPIFNWSDGSAGNNGDIPGFPPNSTNCTSEPDACPIDISLLTVNSPYPGVTINLGSLAGTSISYIRIFSFPVPPDTAAPNPANGINIDAIQVFP